MRDDEFVQLSSVYNMDGDTYVTISWHMKMPGNKHQKKVKAKLHIARIKEVHGYCHVYRYKWL